MLCQLNHLCSPFVGWPKIWFWASHFAEFRKGICESHLWLAAFSGLTLFGPNVTCCYRGTLTVIFFGLCVPFSVTFCSGISHWLYLVLMPLFFLWLMGCWNQRIVMIFMLQSFWLIDFCLFVLKPECERNAETVILFLAQIVMTGEEGETQTAQRETGESETLLHSAVRGFGGCSCLCVSVYCMFILSFGDRHWHTVSLSWSTPTQWHWSVDIQQ